MSELDYQTALLLQHQYEQEHRARINSQKNDEALARSLQEQYERENYIENVTVAAPNLVYDHKKAAASTKSLTDPSWELIDPTPDIHQLFILFDRQFFWHTLGSVCVSWSKRMTSCAGICTYQGKSGMCSITLSEPLLKLRPRKDLIETLLHEMIHAYLFVTANNRDRDGHGPEFHKHMYRINRESGTNITVYHTFHDEVRLYQQHWWRCNGPCQSWPPFFGMVKRAMNRAPGPHDRWWHEHLHKCGGIFVKVKEPQKNTKKASDKKTVKKPLPDIRNYLPTNKENINDNRPSTSGKNIKVQNSSNDFLSVREHWAKKFNNTEINVNINSKRPTDEIEGHQKKIPKLDLPQQSIAIEFVNCPECAQECLKTDLTNHLEMCLNQEKQKISIIDLTDDDVTDQKECPLCKSLQNVDDFDLHVEQCLIKAYDDVDKKIKDSINKQVETVNCLVCNKKIVKNQLNEHLNICMDGIFDKNNFNNEDTSVESNGKYNCPFCWQLIESDLMNRHIDDCLQTNNIVKSEFSQDF